MTDGCPEVATYRGRCDAHAKGRRQEERSRRTTLPSHKGYGTARWQRTRRRVLTRDGHACTACASTATPLHVDHIDGLGMDGPCAFHEGNLQTLCRSCHARKTALQDGGFGRTRPT